jgi:hypothetical protein
MLEGWSRQQVEDGDRASKAPRVVSRRRVVSEVSEVRRYVTGQEV